MQGLWSLFEGINESIKYHIIKKNIDLKQFYKKFVYTKFFF